MAKGIVIGDPRGIQFEIEWLSDSLASTAAEATRGRLLLWLGEHLVWGRALGTSYRGLIWTWIELLEFMGNSWPYLAYEEGYPLGLQPNSPTRLRDTAESRWLTRPMEMIKREQEELTAFEESHDLARGLQGLFVPSVVFTRFGKLFQIGTRQITIERPAEETLKTLQGFGNAIAAQLKGINDERAVQALEDWNSRLLVGKSMLASAATGRTVDFLNHLFGGKAEDEVTISGDELVLTEPLALVGLTRGILESGSLSTVIALVRSEGKYATPELNALTEQLHPIPNNLLDLKPYDQGYALARWLRNQLGVQMSDRVEPENILKTWGVKCEYKDLTTQVLDAIACWGPRHGPAVWVNMNDKHRLNEGARRATLAHEICHLLIDRNGALPLAEVVNGNIPKSIEQRANAFAAEFLLPRHVAHGTVATCASGQELLDNLSHRYGVSRELAARQVDNSGMLLPQDVREELLPYILDKNFSY